MTEQLKTSPTLILPDIEDIEDEKIKRVCEAYNKALEEFVIAVYSDVSLLRERIEEGTWTPVLQFGGASVGITYGIQAGLYTKIGRLVTITGRIDLTSKGTSEGSVSITGLPFTCKNANGANSAIVSRIANISFANILEGYVGINSISIYLNEVTEVGIVTDIDNIDFTNTSSVILSAIYFTD